MPAPPILRQRCLDQANAAREAALTAATPRERATFLTTAIAYERLASRARS